MQNYPRSQIVEEGYDPDWPGGDTMFGAIADGDERALSYVARPEKLCSKRQSNAQIWFANAPPVEAIPPPGREGWDEGIFEREKAICPVPEKDLYSGAGDPLEPVAEASRSESESKRKEGNVEEATEAFLQEEKNEEPVESRDSGPLVGEGLALPRGIVGSLKRKKKADSV
ncbi:uncharacterized protein MYCFIDRAFT_211980 [Pseudocercospora fijiensis CIRAD86]|uniref:Uncharacterized protein n=1 Tax=Pseudocercospora fijiensis (strain CIRAD86) TaxID=383855 RepID=M3A6B2_PSEFD|nr:uncharacterized protein MYCFIDRAFT_211980 [Pseudocercospora fijiensis CIRAD86]EME80146.1 hypothetical protein MYCFIDRAFT_211980 [Pseudocercospora fijiensis CIRAD86]